MFTETATPQAFENFFEHAEPNFRENSSYYSGEYTSNIPSEGFGEYLQGNADWETIYEAGFTYQDGMRFAFEGYENLSDAEIDDAMEYMLGHMSEEEQAEFFKKIGRFIKRNLPRVAKVVKKYAKPVLKTAGGVVGGIFGAPAAGAKIGGMLGGGISKLAGAALHHVNRGKHPLTGVKNAVAAAQQRAAQGQPIIPQQQVQGLLSQLSGLLGMMPQLNPQANMANYYSGEQFVYNSYGEAISETAYLNGLAETVLEIAEQIYQALPDHAEISREDFVQWAEGFNA